MYEVPQLTYQDEAWLASLTSESLDDGWMTIANEMIVQGVARENEGVHQIDEAKQWARFYFYTELLSFDKDGSPYVKTQAKVESKAGYLLPTNRFVDSMRVLHESGLNVGRVFRGFHEVATYSQESLRNKIRQYQSGLGVEEATAVLNGFGRLLGRDPAEIIARRRSLDVYKPILGWQDEQLFTLATTKPTILGLSTLRLAVHPQYVAEFTGEAGLTPSQLGGLIIEHPNRQLVAVQLELPEFTGYQVSKAVKGLSKSEITDRARALLRGEQGTRPLPAALVAAHVELLAA